MESSYFILLWIDFTKHTLMFTKNVFRKWKISIFFIMDRLFRSVGTRMFYVYNMNYILMEKTEKVFIYTELMVSC